MTTPIECTLTSIYEYDTREHYQNCAKRNKLVGASIVTAVALLIAIVAIVAAFVSGEMSFGWGALFLIVIPAAWGIYLLSDYFAGREYDIAQNKVQSLRELYPGETDSQIKARLRLEERSDRQIGQLTGQKPNIIIGANSAASGW